MKNYYHNGKGKGEYMSCTFCNSEKETKIQSEFEKMQMSLLHKNSILAIYKNNGKVSDGFIINYCPVCGSKTHE